MKKKCFLMQIMCICLLVSFFFPVGVKADEPGKSGDNSIIESNKYDIGKNLSYTITRSGVLTITGNGEMKDWENPYSAAFGTNNYYIEDGRQQSYGYLIKKIIISNGVTHIGSYAFPRFEEVEEIILPNSLVSIGEGAFCGYHIHAHKGDGTYDSSQDSKPINITLPNNLKTIGDRAFEKHIIKGGSITIPGTTQSIGEQAFYDCDLTSVIISNGVQKIGKEAFRNNLLTAVDIPDSVIEISREAFNGNKTLSKISISNYTKKIGFNAFTFVGDILNIYFKGSETDWRSIDFEAGVTSCIAIDKGDYEKYCKGMDTILHLTVDQKTTIHFLDTSKTEDPSLKKGDTFKKEKLIYSVDDKSGTVSVDKTISAAAKISIPATVNHNGTDFNVKKIADGAFQNSKVEEVSIGQNVDSIGKNAFKGCASLKKVTGAKGVTQIGNSAFEGCKKLSNVAVGSNVTTIGTKAFAGCTSLTKITVPSKVTKIGASAFQGDKKLKTVTIKSAKLNTKKVGKNAFKGINAKATIKVPKKVLKAYKKWLTKKGLPKKAKIK